MADNLDVTPGTGATAAADDIGGVLFQRVKLIHGADGTNDGDVSNANPLPIDDAGGSLTVDGTVAVTGTVDLGATDNAVLDAIAAKDFATQTTLAAINTKLASGTVIGDVNLGATDNAVLDAIAAKDFATQTTLAALNAKLVTGTVIGDVNLGATDNAVLDTIDAVLDTIKTDTAALVVDVAALEVDLAAIEVLATSIDADTNDIKTAVQLIDNTVGAIAGPGSPVIDSYTHASINLAAGANQVLVSSAASKQIWVYGIGFTVNVAGTVSFQDEDDTAISGIMNLDAKGGIVVSPSGNFAMPIWKLATDKDLEVDVVTSELDGWIDYAIVSV